MGIRLIRTIERPVISRYKEAASGPTALNDLQKALTLSRAFLSEARANRTAALEAGDPPRFTEEELASVEETVKGSEKWLKDGIAKQKVLTKREDPFLRTADMETRGIALQKLVKGLEKKKVPKPSKPPTSVTRSSSESAPSATDSADGGRESQAPYTREEL